MQFTTKGLVCTDSVRFDNDDDDDCDEDQEGNDQDKVVDEPGSCGGDFDIQSSSPTQKRCSEYAI